MYGTRAPRFGPLPSLLVVLPLCALMGAFIALGSTQLTMLAIGGVVGLFLLFVPIGWILLLLLLLSFLVVGLGMFYLGQTQLHWVPYALCLLLWMKLPLERLAERQQGQAAPMPTPLFVWALYAYFAFAVLSSLVNETPLINWLVGGKNFIFVWSILFLMASLQISDRFLRVAVLLLLVIGLLQGPFAVSQHYIAFARHGNWDSVVGTFGGDPDGGGGGSGVMAIFLSLVIGLAVALLRERSVIWWFGVGTVASGLLAIMMAETKVFFVLLPLALLLVLGRDLVRRPAFSLLVLAVTGAVLIGIGAYYRETYFRGEVDRSASSGIGDYLDYVVRTDSRIDFINPRTGEVSRVGAPFVWAKEAGFGGPHGYFIGYGMTASRASQTVGYGEAARRFPFMLTTSALTVLLWDVGVLGTLAFLLVLLLGAREAHRIGQHPQIPPFHRSTLRAYAAGTIVLVATIPFNNAVVDAPALQVLLALMLGTVLHWRRRLHRLEPA